MAGKWDSVSTLGVFWRPLVTTEQVIPLPGAIRTSGDYQENKTASVLKSHKGYCAVYVSDDGQHSQPSVNEEQLEERPPPSNSPSDSSVFITGEMPCGPSPCQFSESLPASLRWFSSFPFLSCSKWPSTSLLPSLLVHSGFSQNHQRSRPL